MLITHIHIVTNGGDTKAYVRAEDAIESLELPEDDECVLLLTLPSSAPGMSLLVIPDNRQFLTSMLGNEGYLDIAGNTGTRINRIKLNSGDMQAVLIPEGADIEEY